MSKKTNDDILPSENTETKNALEALEPEMRKRVIAGAKRSGELPKFEEQEGGTWSLNITDTVTYLEMFGGCTPRFCGAMATACANMSGRSVHLQEDKNDAIAIIAEIAPKDGIEAMLATQMAAVHTAMMRHSRLMAGADTIPQLDVHEKVFNKLGRTFTAQLEALRKHRHGGQQKMTVEHVTVEKGGQAIVGNVTKGGGT